MWNPKLLCCAKTHHWFLFWVESTSWLHVLFIPVFITSSSIRLGFRSGPFPSEFPTNILYQPHNFPFMLCVLYVQSSSPSVSSHYNRRLIRSLKLHNGKVKVTLHIIKHEVVKTYGGRGVTVRILWLVSFTLHTPGTCSIWGWLNLTATLEEKTSSFFLPGIKRWSSGP
jgi:hypothetical protein